MLKKREYTKKEITELKAIENNISFNLALVGLLEEFRQGSKVKSHIADFITEEIPLHKALSVTWLVYEVCNSFNDSELGVDYLSELVADVEDLVEGIEVLVEKHKRK